MSSENADAAVPGEDGGLRRWWWLDFALPVVVLVLGTAFFWSGERDLAALMPYFSEVDGWRQDAQPWKAIYEYGVIPTALLTFACLVTLPLSYWLRRLRIYRASAVFFLLVVAIGPGLITNAVLKDHWGRPRPRSIEQFGGKYAFEPILRIDKSSRGKSFACGHASAVLVLASTWLLLRERRKTRTLAWAVLGLGTTYGILTCYARVIQGGHFVSDCIWAWGIVSLSTSCIYWFLRKKIHRRPLTMCLEGAKKRESGFSTGFKITALIFVCGFFFTFLLGIPYRVTFDHYPQQEATSRPLPFRFNLGITQGFVEVRSGESVRWRSSASGFGYAGSRLAETWMEEMETSDSGEEIRKLGHLQRVSGFFSEISQTGQLTLPMQLLRRLKIEIEEGDVTFYLPGQGEFGKRSDWRLTGSPSEVVLILPEGNVPNFEIRGLEKAPEGSEGLMRPNGPGIWRAGGIPVLVIKNETTGAIFRVKQGSHKVVKPLAEASEGLSTQSEGSEQTREP